MSDTFGIPQTFRQQINSGAAVGTSKQATPPPKTGDITLTHNGQQVTVTEQELLQLAQKGYDYTQKTQTLSDERRAFEQEKSQAQAALKLVSNIKNDPHGTIGWLAQTYNIDPSPPTQSQDSLLDPDMAEMERRIDQKLARLEQTMRGTQVTQQRMTAQQHFAAANPDAPLMEVEQFAQANGINDLNIAYKAMRADSLSEELNSLRSGAGQDLSPNLTTTDPAEDQLLRQQAAGNPTISNGDRTIDGQPSGDSTPAQPQSLREAFLQAERLLNE